MNNYNRIHLYGPRNPLDLKSIHQLPIIDQTSLEDDSIFKIYKKIKQFTFLDLDLICIIDPGWEIIGSNSHRHTEISEFFKNTRFENRLNDESVYLLEHMCFLYNLKTLYSNKLHIHDYNNTHINFNSYNYPELKSLVINYCCASLNDLYDSNNITNLNYVLRQKVYDNEITHQ